jgi:tRNA-dihydrouridine synthase
MFYGAAATLLLAGARNRNVDNVTTAVTSNTRRHDINEKLILAPMVRGSELAFRMLIRQHGGLSLCYSPMLRASEVVKAHDLWKQQKSSEVNHEDGKLLLTDSATNDRPLVVQLCGSSPQELYTATRAVLEIFDEVHKNPLNGIDLNLGCPQKCAHDGGFGAFLAEERAMECVAAMQRAIDDGYCGSGNERPWLSCKIRLLDSTVQTIAFAQGLQDAGCQLLAVHCRQRTDKHHGECDLETGKQLVHALTIPVVINGSITSLKDVESTLERTGCASVMASRALLENPLLFVETSGTKTNPAVLAADYLEFCELYPPPSPLYIQKHLRWIFRQELQPKTALCTREDYRNWKARLWTFLVRPYLDTLSQFRQVVGLYVILSGCDMPPSLKDIGVPSFQSIRHHNKKMREKGRQDDEEHKRPVPKLLR